MSMVLGGNGVSADRAIESIAGSANILASPAVLTDQSASIQPLADGGMAQDADDQTASTQTASTQPDSAQANASAGTQDQSVAAQAAANQSAGVPSPDIQQIVNDVSALLDSEGTIGSGLPGSQILGGTGADGGSGLDIAPIIAGSDGLVPSLLGSGTGDDNGSGLPIVGSLDSPGGVLDGAGVTDSVTGTVDDLLHTTGLTGGVGQDVNDLLGGLGVTGDGSQGGILDLAGPGTLTQPLIEPANAAIQDVHALLELTSDEIGLNQVVHSVTNLGDTVGLGYVGSQAYNGTSNLLTDTLNLPGDTLSGDAVPSIQNIGNDLTADVHAATGVLDAAVNGPDTLNPVPELIQSVGQDANNGSLINLGDNGLLSGSAGSVASSPSSHLIDVDVGQSQPQSGADLNVLATPDAGNHPAEVGVIDVGATGPNLASLGVLTGDSPLSIPSLGGTGTDGLVGTALGSVQGDHGGHGTVLPAVADLPVLSDIASIADPGQTAAGADHGILHLNGTGIL